MVNEKAGKISSGRMVKYCLISLVIGVCIAFINYGLFLGYVSPLLSWEYVFFSYIMPDAIIGLFCFVLKHRGSVWGDKKERFLCLCFLISGYFITSLLMNSHFFQFPAHIIILGSFILRFIFGFISYPIAVAVSVYATEGVKGWKRVLAVIILSIFILWPGPLFIPSY